MVDAGATSHIIKIISKFKTFDDSFQPDNHFIELAGGTGVGRFIFISDPILLCNIGSLMNIKGL